jgi:LmbE family N-acetylglucosaminyl deacetylase
MQLIRAGAMVAVIGAALASGLLLSRAHGGGALPLPVMPAPTARDRILVVAPHCDDETLGAGGLLFSAVRAGAKIRVVIDTNGDGFHYGAERLFHEKHVSPLDYVRMGLDRQRETLAALSDLGVPRRAVSFLGYPDAGTADMWLTYWDPRHPYTSPRTLEDHSPYPNAFTRYTPYAGRSLLDDLKKIIADFKPTVIICPHPDDEHPDHWAAYCYTAAALYELGLLDSVQLRFYIIHRGNWPMPRGLHRREPLQPPADLSGPNTRWQAFPLDSRMEGVKYQAILRYGSQLLVMRDFLLGFDRTNELFGAMHWGRLPVVASGAIKIDGQAGEWGQVAPVILDSPEKRRKVPAAADVVDARAATDGRRIYVQVDLAGPPSADVEYRIWVRALSASRVGPPQEYVFRPGGRIEGEARFSSTALEAALPIPGTEAPDGVMLAVDTARDEKRLDGTAWVLLRVQPQH